MRMRWAAIPLILAIIAFPPLGHAETRTPGGAIVISSGEAPVAPADEVFSPLSDAPPKNREGDAPSSEENGGEDAAASFSEESDGQTEASSKREEPKTSEESPDAPAPSEAATPQGEEFFFAETDGISYYCGDPNYPVWSKGRRVAAVADLSSAYISEDDGKWRLISFLSFPVVLREKGGFSSALPLEEELRECWFWQKTKTGEIFFYREGRPGNKVEGAAFLLERIVYGMLLDAAERNAEIVNQ